MLCNHYGCPTMGQVALNNYGNVLMSIKKTLSDGELKSGDFQMWTKMSSFTELAISAVVLCSVFYGFALSTRCDYKALFSKMITIMIAVLKRSTSAVMASFWFACSLVRG